MHRSSGAAAKQQPAHAARSLGRSQEDGGASSFTLTEGGGGGGDIFLSPDQHYVLKTLDAAELRLLLRMLPSCAEHLPRVHYACQCTALRVASLHRAGMSLQVRGAPARGAQEGPGLASLA